MAQIPQLQRITPTNTMPQNDRINIQAKDQGAQILQQTNTIAELGDKGAQMYKMYQDDKIEQISNVAEQEYKAWHDKKLSDLKNYQGDPTEAYAKYDEEVAQKKSEMLDKRSKFGEDVSTALTSRLDKVAKTQAIAADYQRGQQQEVYANNVFESTVKTRRDGLAVNAGYIQKGDPTSFMMFDQNVGEIKSAIAKFGVKKGTVKILPDDAEGSDYYIDDNGKKVNIEMSPIAKSRFAKDLSEGVKGSLDVLISTGRIDEARELQKRYGGVLTPIQAAKLEGKFQSASRKNEAYNVLGNLKGLDDSEAIDKIESIKDPVLKSEVLKLKDNDDRHLTNMRTRKEKVNYDALGEHVMEIMKSDKPYLSKADLEADPKYQQMYDNLNLKQKKAIDELVEAPKNTDPKALVRVQNLFMDDEDGQDIANMTPQEFAEATAGLSKQDKTKYSNLYMTLKTQTEGEKRAMYKSAGSILRDQLIADGHISLNPYGKLDEDNQKILTNARTKLITFISNQPSLRDDKKIIDFVKQNSAALVKEKAFNPVMPAGVKKSSRDVAGDVKITKQQLLGFQREWKAKNGKFANPSDPAFEAFVKSKLVTKR